MASLGIGTVEAGRLTRLLAYLEEDPDNLHLLADAAAAAYDEGDHAAALALIARSATLEAPAPALLNLRGLAALGAGDFAGAADAFRALREADEDEPTVRFNLAWALTMAGAHAEALPLLDDAAVAAGPRGAALKVQLLHQLGDPEAALEAGTALAADHAGDTFLMGALALAAMDAGRADLARSFAEQAGASHDGLSTMGLLLLDEDRLGESAALFDRILAADAGNPRALLGKGLERLARGETAAAAGWLDQAAQRFGDHLGSWIAAGWAHYVHGDLAAARERFETALALDDTFAETHGALAVLDIAAGRIEEGRARAETARRLDRAGYGGALATALLLEHDGKPEAAARVRRAAHDVPAGVGGRTLAQALAARAR